MQTTGHECDFHSLSTASKKKNRNETKRKKKPPLDITCYDCMIFACHVDLFVLNVFFIIFFFFFNFVKRIFKRNMGDREAIPADPESDCLMAYSGPELDTIYSLEVTSSMFLFGSYNGMIRGFYLEDPIPACELPGHSSIVRDLLCVSDNEILLSCSMDGKVKKWNMDQGEQHSDMWISQWGVERLKMTSDSKIVASCDGSGAINIWKDLSQSKSLEECHSLRLSCHVGSIKDITLLQPTSSQLQCITASSDGHAKYIDITTQKLLSVYEGCCSLNACAVDTNTSLVYVGGSGNQILIFDIRSAACVGQLRGHSESITGLTLVQQSKPENQSENGAAPSERGSVANGIEAVSSPIVDSVLYSTSEDKSISQWNTSTKSLEYSFKGHNSGISCICYTNSGQLFTGSYDKSVRMWDVDGAKQNIALRTMYNSEHPTDRGTRHKSDKEHKGKSSKKGSKGKKEKKSDKKPKKAKAKDPASPAKKSTKKKKKKK